MTRKTKETKEADALAPVVTLEIDGKNYELCFDFAALLAAERGLRDSGQPVNMLRAVDLRNAVGAEQVAALFYASLLRRQPETTPAQAVALIGIAHMQIIWAAVLEAYLRSCMPAAKKDGHADPTVGAGDAAES